ncbi:MAG: PAS-domain containing protein [Janthinobacterium lividum]
MESLNPLFQKINLDLLYENSFFIFSIFGAFGYLVAFIFFFVYRNSIACEKANTLNILKILASAEQEWFCFYPLSNRGVASSNLSRYLEDEKPIIQLEDFSQAIFKKFSFDIKPIIEDIFSGSISDSKVRKIVMISPITNQSCDLFITPQVNTSSTSGRQKDIIFWLRDTSEIHEKETIYSRHNIELEHQNNLLSKILDMLPQPLWIRTLEGQLTYCNQFYADALETSPHDLIQDNKLIWQENNQERWTTRSVKNTILYEPITQSIVLKEERRLYQFREEKVPDLNLIFGQGTDLTDLEDTKLVLKQHTMAYQEVMDNLSAGVTIYGPDKKLKFFNHAYALLFEIDENWLNTHPSLGEVLDDVRDRRLLSEQADYLSFKKQQLQMVSSLLSPYQQLEHLPDGRTIRRITAPHPLGGVFFIFENITNSLNLERQYNTQL